MQYAVCSMQARRGAAMQCARGLSECAGRALAQAAIYHSANAMAHKNGSAGVRKAHTPQAGLRLYQVLDGENINGEN